MLYCKKCGVSVEGNPDYCPLCQGELSGTALGAQKYPAIQKKPNRLAFALKLAFMITLAAVVICAFIDYCVTGAAFGWWLYVAAGAATLWVAAAVALKLRGNVAKSIFFTTVTGVLLTFLWDRGTGYTGWSVDYVLPISLIAAMLAMAVTSRILKLPIEQYIYYMILDIIFALVPLILILTGAVTLIPLSLASVAASVLSLAALVIFEGRAVKAEIIRRTHL